MKTDDQIRHFRPRIQADLDWLINSPDLLSISTASKQLSIPLINASDFITNFRLLETTELDSIPHQLGRYFEQLWFNLVRQQPDIEVLHENLQLRDDKQTIGEFDVILRHLEKQLTVHCELAVKFYLNLGDGNRLADWHGPNLSDRLDLKYQRLITHQLQLSRHLKSINNINYQAFHIDLIGLFTKGRLYYPFEKFQSSNFIHPAEICQDHLKGFWVSTNKFEQIRKQNPDIQWYLLPKSHWMAELKNTDLNNLIPYSQTKQINSQQVAGFGSDKELMRGFIVSDEWIKKSQLA